jgi:hypothetical protein
MPFANPQLFVKNYFDHTLMKKDGYGYNINTIQSNSAT